MPDALAFLGIGLVLAAGLYTLHRERRGLRRAAAAPQRSPTERRRMKPNRMKEKIARGEPALGCSVMFPSPQVVEMLGFAGFDWVLIDCEHGSIGLGRRGADGDGLRRGRHHADRAAEDQCAERHPERDGPRRDGRAGAARQHRRGCAPRGGRRQVRPRRGARAGRRHAARQLGPRRAHARFRRAAANAQSLVCVQLEHAAAIANIDEILAVEGIDVFFIGPSDLSQSMGFPGNPKAPPVAKAIDETLAKIVAAGRTPGMPATAETLRRGRGQGLPLHLHASAAPASARARRRS